MSDDEQNLLALYRQLHDRISDMIEDGRCPSCDYKWLVNHLMECAALDAKLEAEYWANG